MSQHNLPPQLTSFVGRTKEIADICALLSDPNCHLLTLLGAGGIGKTRLALQVTVEAGHQYADGVYFVPLQSLNSAQFIVSAIADAIDFQFYEGNSHPKDQLLSYLRELEILLVLDNYEHLLDGAPFLSEILHAAPHLKILTTSRERLNLVEEWVFDVGELTYPDYEAETDIETYDAVQLYLQRARQIRSDGALSNSQKSAVLRICHLVGGMPLGIELAATWSRSLPFEDIVTELERGLDVLQTSARNVEPRHRDIRAAFEPMWNQLSDQEQTTFSQLSQFRGGFTREAAVYVAGASLHILPTLVDRSLIRLNDDGRYDLHELLRQYAEEHLKQTPNLQDKVLDRHCEFYTELLHRHKDTIQSGDRAALHEEIDNIRAAWMRAVNQRYIDALKRTASALHWLYENLGWQAEGQAMFLMAEEAVAEIPETEERRYVLTMLRLRRCFFQAIYPNVSKQLRDDIATTLVLLDGLEEQHETRELITIAILTLLRNKGDTEKITALAHKRMILSQNANDQYGIAISLITLAVMAFSVQGEFAQAEEYTNDALEIDQKIGFYINSRWGKRLLGNIYSLRGRYLKAKGLYESCIADHMAGDIQQNLDYAYFLLGMAALELGDYPTAQLHFEGCAKTASKLRRHGWIVQGRIGLGLIDIYQGNIDRAERCLDDAYDYLQSVGINGPINHAEIDAFGILMLVLGNDRQALEYYEAILSNYGTDYRVVHMVCQCRIGQACIGLDDQSRAKSNLLSALRESLAMGASAIVLETLLGIAQLSSVPAALAVELLTFIRDHSASNHYSRFQANHILTNMHAVLSPDEWTNASGRGQELTLEAAVALVGRFDDDVHQPPLTASQVRIDPLTEREVEVLTLIADGLNSREVAERLHLSVTTIRWYLRRMYTKLDVHSRTQAIARAKDLNLLP